MAKHIDPIPENMTIEEASEFWDTHDVSDYPTQIVQFEYTPGEQTLEYSDLMMLLED
ncbi:MAG: hypothetical protein JW725_05615 [Candidatus Babeliaceae bacterium]|nr:hypothetical protein [Candidatus Babeliaceae bacterium]